MTHHHHHHHRRRRRRRRRRRHHHCAGAPAGLAFAAYRTWQAHNDILEGNRKALEWESPVIQSFWIVIALQPMLHVVIFFTKRENRQKASLASPVWPRQPRPRQPRPRQPSTPYDRTAPTGPSRRTCLDGAVCARPALPLSASRPRHCATCTFTSSVNAAWSRPRLVFFQCSVLFGVCPFQSLAGSFQLVACCCGRAWHAAVPSPARRRRTATPTGGVLPRNC